MARLGTLFASIVMLATLLSGVAAKGNPVQVGGTDTGMHMSLDLRTLSLAKEIIFDKIIGFIDDVKIPDVQLKGNKGYLIENAFQLSHANKIVNFYNDIKNNAVVFEADNLAASFHCGHFKLKEGFVQAKGHADVELQRLKLQVGIKFMTQQLLDGRTLPAVQTVDVQFMISEQDIQVHLHGNVWSEFAGSFISFFKGPMIKLIETSNEQAINIALPLAVNQAISATEGSVNFGYDHMMVDMITPKAPEVSLDTLTLGFKGLFFDERIGDYDRVRFPAMPFKNMTHLDQFQMFVSMQTLDSFFEAYLDTQGGHGWYNETVLPPPLDFTLTTTDLNIMLPGMVNTYGKNRPVKLEFEVLDFGDFRSKFAKDYMIATATVNVRFWVTKENNMDELAVEMNLYNITNKVSLIVNDFNAKVAVREFRLHGVEVTHSSLGLLNPNTIRLKLNTVNSVIVTLANIILQGFEVNLPRSFAGMFSLNDLNLEYFDGYIYAGVTPSFTPHIYQQEDLAAKIHERIGWHEHSEYDHLPPGTVVNEAPDQFMGYAQNYYPQNDYGYPQGYPIQQ